MGNEMHHLSVNDRSIVFKKSSFLSEEEIKLPCVAQDIAAKIY
jgi:hypothetical protein